MGELIWEGWQTSAEDAPQPTSILYGKNLRSSSSASSQGTQPDAQSKQEQVAPQQAEKPVK